MHTFRISTVLLVAIIAVMMLGAAAPGSAQGSQGAEKKNEAPPAAIHRLTIEVTGGDANKPIENASVYLRTVKEHAVFKDKKTEINVKTNQLGLAHVPEAPLGRVEIQIIAEGWKTFGRWYDITDPQQVIKIHLERPPKWY